MCTQGNPSDGLDAVHGHCCAELVSCHIVVGPVIIVFIIIHSSWSTQGVARLLPMDHARLLWRERERVEAVGGGVSFGIVRAVVEQLASERVSSLSRGRWIGYHWIGLVFARIHGQSLLLTEC